MEDVKVPEVDHEYILDALRDSGEKVVRAYEEARAASEERRKLVEQAMNLGVPRKDIAAALGVHRNVLYQILGDTQKRK